VQQHAVDLPAAPLVFAILAAGLLLGGLGVVPAPPLTVVTFVLVKRLYVREALDTPTGLPGEPEERAERR
jgi:predicted PurR-regulated permease PerM